MAKAVFKADDEFLIKLSKANENIDNISKKAVYNGAEVLADAVREEIEALPEDEYRRLSEEEKFQGVPPSDKEALLATLGIAEIKSDQNGCNTSISFDGYASMSTKKYPNGVPVILIARSINAGSAVRKKIPFVRKAKNKVKNKITQVMNKTIKDELNKLGG